MTQRLLIVPVEGFRLYGTLVKKEVELSRKGQGTFYRSAGKMKNRARWSHRNYGGWVKLERAVGEVVAAEIRSRQQDGGDWQLLHAFVGFLTRHFGDRIEAIHIHFPRAD